MTCIVGLVDKASGKVFIGGDSLGTDENGGTLVNTYGKVFHNGDFLIGKCGSLRMGQIVRYAFKPSVYDKPLFHEDDYLACYMATLFVQEMKACFDSLDYKEEHKGCLLVGFQGRLFKINLENFQVEEEVSGYNAIGVGADIALGSLWTTRNKEYTPRSRIELALQASAEHNAHVGPPFIIESI